MSQPQKKPKVLRKAGTAGGLTPEPLPSAPHATDSSPSEPALPTDVEARQPENPTSEGGPPEEPELSEDEEEENGDSTGDASQQQTPEQKAWNDFMGGLTKTFLQIEQRFKSQDAKMSGIASQIQDIAKSRGMTTEAQPAGMPQNPQSPYGIPPELGGQPQTGQGQPGKLPAWVEQILADAGGDILKSLVAPPQQVGGMDMAMLMNQLAVRGFMEDIALARSLKQYVQKKAVMDLGFKPEDLKLDKVGAELSQSLGVTATPDTATKPATESVANSNPAPE